MSRENMFSAHQSKCTSNARTESQPNSMYDTSIEVDKNNRADDSQSSVNVETFKPAEQCRFTDDHETRFAALDGSLYSHTTVTKNVSDLRKHNTETQNNEFLPVIIRDAIQNDNLSCLHRHENGHLLLRNSIYRVSLRHPVHAEPLSKHPSLFCSDISSFYSTFSYSSHTCSTSRQGDSDIDSDVFDLNIYDNRGYQEESDDNRGNQEESDDNRGNQEESDDNIGCTVSSTIAFTKNIDFENGDNVHLNNDVNIGNITSENHILKNINHVDSTDQDNNYVVVGTDFKSNRNVQHQETDLRYLMSSKHDEKNTDDVADKIPQPLYTKVSIGRDSHSSINKHHPAAKRKSSNKKELTGDSRSENLDRKLTESFCMKYFSCRWRLAYLCFLVRFIQTALRQSMGVAIIGMTLRKPSDPGSQMFNTSDINVTQILIEDFQWSSAFEGAILTSFNMGSVITPIIVGYLTTRHGGRKLMTLCLAAGGVFTVFLPVAARVNTVLIIVFRVFTGIALSGTDSLVQSMLARWAPLYEKASLSVCAYTGLSVAGVLTFLVCGYIVSIGGDGNGWPYIFYIFGSLCIALAPVWYFNVYDNPHSHPKITKRELAIIAFNKQPGKYDTCKQELNTPWRRIFKSPAVWVILMGHVTHKWVLSFMLSYLPRYFADLFHFDMKTDGFFSSIPFVGRIATGIAAGYVSDWMLRRGVTTERTRKFFQATGCWGCAVCSLLIALVPAMSSVWSISLLVLALSCQDLTSVAFRINVLDIAPRYAGLLNGMVSTVATLTSLPAPVITSMLISGGSRHGWQVVFCLVASLNIIGGAIFSLFAKGEVQDWAEANYEENIPEETKDDLGVFTLDSNNVTILNKYDVVNGKVVRAVQSLPANIQRKISNQKEKVSRRATFYVASMIKRVQNDAFANLALADM